MYIPITKPWFGEQELRAVQLPLESGWVVQGPYVQKFEDAFSAFTGSAFSVAASSCTTALHMVVAALGLRPGDEVFVMASTRVSTPNGAKMRLTESSLSIPRKVVSRYAR